MSDIDRREIVLSSSEHAKNALRALIKGLPWIGASLEQLIHGGGDERRWRRMERTLSELDAEMKRRHIPGEALLKEEFEQLLRTIGPSIVESTNEQKRRRFRDLLITSVDLPDGDPEWESSRLAAEYLEQLEGPAFAILAALAAEGAFDDSGKPVSVSRYPEPQVSELSGAESEHYETDRVYHALGYEWAVVQSWTEKLLALKLISSGTTAGSRGFGQLRLTAKGAFLVKWTVSNPKNEAESNE